MSYGQFFERGVALGYEWRLRPKATPTGGLTHDLEWYIADGLGTDYSASATPAINVGQATLKGPVLSRIPHYTAVLVEGAEGAYIEDKDASAETNFGRLERYAGDKALADSGSLTAAGDELLDEEATNRKAVQISVVATDDHPRPLVDYLPGDKLQIQLPPGLTKTARRIRLITWQNSIPTSYQITGSRVFEGESAAYEAIRRLLRVFTPLDETGFQDTSESSVQASGALDQTGATIRLTQSTGAQSIPVSGDIVQWDTSSEIYQFSAPPEPALSVTIPKPGYYNIAVRLRWASFAQGGSVSIIRERSGDDQTIWPLTSQTNMWTATVGQEFEAVAPNLHLLAGDTIRLFVDHNDASPQSIESAVMDVYLVDRTAVEVEEWELIFTVDNYGVTFVSPNWWTSDHTDDINPAMFKRDNKGAVVASYAGWDTHASAKRNRNMTYDGSALMYGVCNEEDVFSMDPSDGTTAKVFDILDGGTHVGIAYKGTTLWIVERDDLKIYEYSLGGSKLQTISQPAGRDLNGLAWDGTNWWGSLAGSGDTIVKMDVDFAELSTIAAPLASGNHDLYYEGGYLYQMTDLGLYRKAI